VAVPISSPLRIMLDDFPNGRIAAIANGDQCLWRERILVRVVPPATYMYTARMVSRARHHGITLAC
jgi:hypothetical protein